MRPRIEILESTKGKKEVITISPETLSIAIDRLAACGWGIELKRQIYGSWSCCIYAFPNMSTRDEETQDQMRLLRATSGSGRTYSSYEAFHKAFLKWRENIEEYREKYGALPGEAHRKTELRIL